MLKARGTLLHGLVLLGFILPVSAFGQYATVLRDESIKDGFTEVRLSADGRYVAAKVYEKAGRVFLWDRAEPSRRAKSFETFHVGGPSLRPEAIAFHPRDKDLVTVRQDEATGLSAVVVIDPATGEEVRKVGTGEPPLAFVAGARYLAAMTPKKPMEMVVYDWESGKSESITLATENFTAERLAAHPTAPILAVLNGSAGNRDIVTLWDLEKREKVGSSRMVIQQATALRFSNQGDRLFTADTNGLRIWDPGPMRVIKTIPEIKQVEDLALPGKDDLLFVATSYEGTRIWSLADGTQRGELLGDRNVKQLAVSQNGEILVSPMSDTDSPYLPRGVQVWDWRSALRRLDSSRVLIAANTNGNVPTARFTPDGKALAIRAGGYSDCRVLVYNLEALASRPKVLTVLDPSSTRQQVPKFIQRIVSVSATNELWLDVGDGGRLHDGATLAPRFQYGMTAQERRNPRSPFPVAFGPGGIFASREFDRVIPIYDRAGKRLSEVRGVDHPAHGWSFGPDGKTLALGFSLYEVGHPEGQLQSRLEQNAGAPDRVVFLNEGKRIIGWNQKIMIWDPEENTLEYPIPMYNKLTYVGLVRAALSADQSLLFTAKENSVQLWDLPSRTLLATLGKHDNPIEDGDLNPNGKQAVTVDKKGQVRLWDLSGLRAPDDK